MMINTANTALLVIDFQERLMPHIHMHEVLERRAAAMVDGCKLLDIPIITMQQYTKGLGETVAPIKKALDGIFNPMDKVTFSGCKNEAIAEGIKNLGRSNLIVTGVEAHICVQLTVLDLLEAGYSVYVAADCIGSRHPVDYKYAEMRMSNAGAVFSTLEAILFELMVSAEHPKRKEISKLVLGL
jgi:nicotinamidase-related amidase